ncbi:MAG TPA: YtxH domain-containing protein [Chthonomonadaceae bacterium]|nr:YtxH domain-containing protein [Chthonomonadaceae bacterium]
MSKENNWGGNLVFFLLGAATGAAIALLYAPQDGESTRRFLGDKAGEVKDKVGEVTANVAQTTKDTWSMATDKVQSLINRGQQTAKDGIDSAADAARAGVNSVS